MPLGEGNPHELGG